MAYGFGSYEIARSGLVVNERGLYVTGHNISNISTPGYVRQQAMIMDRFTQRDINGFQYGLGADIQQIRQIRHSFLDSVYRQESTSCNYWEARAKTFEDIEAILGEPMGDGLQDMMNQFWDSWQELSKDPTSLTTRAMVRQRGESLAYHINHLGAQLDKLQADLNSEVLVRIEEVNDTTEQIALLNAKILNAEVCGDTANDYRDQRNVLLDRLCELVEADITERRDGQLDIIVGGQYLVHGNEYTKISAVQGAKNGMFYTPILEGTSIELEFKSGALKGLLESRGEVFGAKGSLENGTPNTKADIVFIIDISQGSSANIEKIKASIIDYVDELARTGMDYNLRLVTYGASVYYNNNFGADLNAFVSAVKDAGIVSENGDTDGNFENAVNELGLIPDFRQDAGRYAVVFSHESIGGNAPAVPLTEGQVDGYIAALKSKGIITSVVTDAAAGFDAGEPKGWESVAGETGGTLYSVDIGTEDYSSLLALLNNGIKENVNRGISEFEVTRNIIPDLRKRLNALVNIMAREINYLHRSGKTLGSNPVSGEDFFTVIDSTRPIEMGNIKLNDIFATQDGLNYIVSSGSGDSGDNSIALKIANLRTVPVMREISGILSMDEYYQSIILNVGHGGSEAASTADNQGKLVQSADNLRQSIMGVSMDEEMTSMMKYKFAYDASARVINVIDEMVENIIEKMGLVGR